MPKYFVETEHVRGEPRIYWVAEKLSGPHYRSRTRSVTEFTTSKRKAEKDCDRLNGQSVSVTNGDRKAET